MTTKLTQSLVNRARDDHPAGTQLAAAVPREGTVDWPDAAAIAHLETVLRDAVNIITGA